MAQVTASGHPVPCKYLNLFEELLSPSSSLSMGCTVSSGTWRTAMEFQLAPLLYFLVPVELPSKLLLLAELSENYILIVICEYKPPSHWRSPWISSSSTFQWNIHLVSQICCKGRFCNIHGCYKACTEWLRPSPPPMAWSIHSISQRKTQWNGTFSS